MTAGYYWQPSDAGHLGFHTFRVSPSLQFFLHHVYVNVQFGRWLKCGCVFPLQSELTNLQWQDVQNRLIEVQKVHQMCVHKEELTELGLFVFLCVCVCYFKYYLFYCFSSCSCFLIVLFLLLFLLADLKLPCYSQ